MSHAVPMCKELLGFANLMETKLRREGKAEKNY